MVLYLVEEKVKEQVNHYAPNWELILIHAARRRSAMESAGKYRSLDTFVSWVAYCAILHGVKPRESRYHGPDARRSSVCNDTPYRTVVTADTARRSSMVRRDDIDDLVSGVGRMAVTPSHHSETSSSRGWSSPDVVSRFGRTTGTYTTSCHFDTPSPSSRRGTAVSDFVEEKNLRTKTNIGGRLSRTKREFADDIADELGI
eukprot:TRINITY_DN1297_c1_g1_i1.p1 TRINITY_DN1297_c1_g1~~TRINITY_DN1297_c1_g1_i1.p1  ORF type:complete len:201 (+),score=1.66 TRINITY_DN1297_c1_g1_i1:630-1232(+)